MRVLVAENNADNARLMQHYYGIFEWCVDTVANGQECVAVLAAASEPYDIVFMDIDMPTMNGIEAAENIRAHGVEAVRRIPILAVSADWSMETKRRARAAGIDGYITKPVDFEELTKTALSLVSGS